MQENVIVFNLERILKNIQYKFFEPIQASMSTTIRCLSTVTEEVAGADLLKSPVVSLLHFTI